MTTLLTLATARGTRRCDARCYNARLPECRCICGGKFHGRGLDHAAEQDREWAAEQGIGLPAVQAELDYREPAD